MTVEKLYPEEPKGEGERRHKPEVIIPGEEERNYQQEMDDRLQAIKIRSSLALRFIMLLVAFIGALTLAFNLLVLVGHSVLVIATFLRSPVFIDVWRRTVRAVKRWTVITLGSALAVLLPGIGITFMLSYFLISSDMQRQNMFMRILRGHVDQGGNENGPYWS